jgi:Bacterial SH3 domain
VHKSFASTLFPLAIATLGFGSALPAIAQQTRCVSTPASCGEVIYYDQPISTTNISATNNSGFVNTQSGLGLNVRSGPGLDYSVIGGADNGVFLNLDGAPVFQDGYRWQQVSSGGWVATEYLSGNTSNVSFDGNCYRPTSFPNNNCYVPGSSGNNGNGIVNRPPMINQPINRPISFRNGPYIVAVPGANFNKLSQVRRIVPNAYLDRVRQGGFVNAGAYGDLDSARSLAYLLRSNNLDARVIFR